MYFQTAVKLHLFTYICAAVKSKINNNNNVNCSHHRISKEPFKNTITVTCVLTFMSFLEIQKNAHLKYMQDKDSFLSL